MGSGVRQIAAQRGRAAALFRWSLLVFALVTLHLALMTTEHHGAMGDEQHGAMVARAAALSMLAPLVPAPHGDHDTPRNTLDGCPVGVAILPLLMALLEGTLLAFLHHAALVPRGASGWLIVRFAIPPLLPAPRRRALLQVFLI